MISTNAGDPQQIQHAQQVVNQPLQMPSNDNQQQQQQQRPTNQVQALNQSL